MTGLERLRVIADNLNKSTYTQANTSRDIRDSLEQIKREQADDHEIAEWVREQGGVENIQDELANDRELAMVVRDALWPDGKVQCCENGNEQVADELDKRLMPHGMEWPRFEDGEQVKIGDMVELNTMVAKVCGVFISKRGYVLHGESGENTGSDARFDYPNFGRAKRPKQDPVGADGLTIRKGETVWHKDGRGPWTVEVVHADTDQVTCLEKINVSGTYQPLMLTHTKPEPPDSWERWREDAVKVPCTYFGQTMSSGCESCPIREKGKGTDYCYEMQARDLERRAKAIAERERPE